MLNEHLRAGVQETLHVVPLSRVVQVVHEKFTILGLREVNHSTQSRGKSKSWQGVLTKVCLIQYCLLLNDNFQPIRESRCLFANHPESKSHPSDKRRQENSENVYLLDIIDFPWPCSNQSVFSTVLTFTWSTRSECYLFLLSSVFHMLAELSFIS